jgi:hypothetical protein
VLLISCSLNPYTNAYIYVNVFLPTRNVLLLATSSVMYAYDVIDTANISLAGTFTYPFYYQVTISIDSTEQTLYLFGSNDPSHTNVCCSTYYKYNITDFSNVTQSISLTYSGRKLRAIRFALIIYLFIDLFIYLFILFCF